MWAWPSLVLLKPGCLCPVSGSWVQQHMQHKCMWFLLAWVKTEEKYYCAEKQVKTTLTRAKTISKQALDLEIIWHFG